MEEIVKNPNNKKLMKGGKVLAKKKSKRYNIDDEIIIGYNTSIKKDNPPKKKTKKNDKNHKESRKVSESNNNNKYKKTSIKKKKSKWNKIKRVILVVFRIFLILAVLAGIFAFLFISPVFNITEIKVENASKISENTYITISEIQIGENIFKVNKSRVISLIKHEPYVDEVEVTRNFPGTILLTVKERSPEYLIEKEGMYIYIDKNGYALETSSEKLDLPILKGIITDLNTLTMGDRLYETDLSKFNDLIKIIDGIKNNNIEEKLSSIDISNNDNYILKFEEENKKVCIGDTTNLSTKMLWIKYFMNERKDDSGIIHLERKDVYFTPN